MPFHPDAATLLFLFWTVVFMPFNGWLGWWKIKHGKPLSPKSRRFRLACYILFIETVLALVAAQSNGIPVPLQIAPADVIVGIAVTLGLILGVLRARPSNRFPEQQERIRQIYAPENRSQFIFCFAGALGAGIGEEIVYRAVLYELLLRVTGMEIAILVSLLLFTVAHMAQGRLGMLGVAILGLMFQIMYLWTGSLILPMIIHTAYDMVVFARLYLLHKPRPGVAQLEARQAATAS